MFKITRALALGAGLVLSVAAPNAQADPLVQTLTPAEMSAAQFNSLFTPITTVLTSNYGFLNTPNAGVVESQVFAGTGPEAGLYAYAYQFSVNNVTDKSGNPPAGVNSASMLFNATPVGSDLIPPGTLTFGYVITNGQVGGLNLPQAAPGSVVQTPSSIAWVPSQSGTAGTLTFQYLNPTTNTGPLAAGATSGTIVELSVNPFTLQFVSLQNPEPQTINPKAYAPADGSLPIAVPVPEPATILAWTGVIAGLAVRYRFRRKHKTA
ncbi:MAG: hypothetical protein ACHRXM_25680 [Isosphaerales bacterium]